MPIPKIPASIISRLKEKRGDQTLTLSVPEFEAIEVGSDGQTSRFAFIVFETMKSSGPEGDVHRATFTGFEYVPF